MSKALQPNTLFANRFRIITIVAMGGQSVVYKAEDTQLGTQVAIKVMRAPDDGGIDAEACRQFRREYEVLSLGGPGLPAAVTMLEHDGRPVVVEEWIDGKTLDHLGTDVPVEQAIRLMLRILETLEHLHERVPPVIVRDIKPSNIVLRGETPWIIDLTSARPLTGTRDTVALGTPGFAAPEQHGGASEIRSDLFSAGALLSYLLTGEDGTLTKLPCRPGRLRRDVSPALDAVVCKATQFAPEARFSSAREMADALRLAEASPDVIPRQCQGVVALPVAPPTQAAPGAQGPPAAKGKRKGGSGQGARPSPSPASPPVAAPTAYPWSGPSTAAGTGAFSGASTAAASTSITLTVPSILVVATFVGLTLRLCAWCAFSLEMGIFGFVFMVPWLLSSGIRSMLAETLPAHPWAWTVGLLWIWGFSFSLGGPGAPQVAEPISRPPVRSAQPAPARPGALVAGDPRRADLTFLPRLRNVTWVPGPGAPERRDGRLFRVDQTVVAWEPGGSAVDVLDISTGATSRLRPLVRVVDVVPAVVRNLAPSLVIATEKTLGVIEISSGRQTESLALKAGERVHSLVSLWRRDADVPEGTPLVAVLFEGGRIALYDRHLTVMALGTVPAQVASDPSARLHGCGARIVVGGTQGFWTAPLPLKDWTRLDGLPPGARAVPDGAGTALDFVAPRHMARVEEDGTLRVAVAERDYEPRVVEAPVDMGFRHCRKDTNYGKQLLLADRETLNAYRTDAPESLHGSGGPGSWSPRPFWYRPLQGDYLAMAVDRTEGAPVGVLSQKGTALHWVAWNSMGQKIDEAMMLAPAGATRPLGAVLTSVGGAVLYPEGVALLKP